MKTKVSPATHTVGCGWKGCATRPTAAAACPPHMPLSGQAALRRANGRCHRSTAQHNTVCVCVCVCACMHACMHVGTWQKPVTATRLLPVRYRYLHTCMNACKDGRPLRPGSLPIRTVGAPSACPAQRLVLVPVLPGLINRQSGHAHRTHMVIMDWHGEAWHGVHPCLALPGSMADLT